MQTRRNNTNDTNQSTDGRPEIPRTSHIRADISPFHRHAIRAAFRRALSVSAVLAFGFAVAAIPTPALATTPPQSNAQPAHDFDHDALHLYTTTDALPGTEAVNFEAIAGNAVRRVYYLHNNGLLPLDDVTVSDPEAGGAIHCGLSGEPTVAILLPLAGIVCSATFTAAQGEHNTTVTASGTVLLFGAEVTDADSAGYTAVVPSLSASLSLNGGHATALPAGTPVSATVTVHNSGTAALAQLSPNPESPLSGFNCGPQGSIIGRLNAGQSATCVGSLTPESGAHVSGVTVVGNWLWERPITEQGPQQPQSFRIQTAAEAPYTGIPVTSSTPPAPPPPPSPGSVPPSNPATTPTPPLPRPGSAGVIPPPFPQSTPSPGARPTANRSPGSSPGSTPVPGSTSAIAVLQGVSQFRTTRELSLPLKVLVIIIIPAVAAAIGARRIGSRR